MTSPTAGRITEAFDRILEQGRKALITYITAGDPNLHVTSDLVLTLEKAGADIVELGIPYSDPLADGPVLQRAAARALQHRIGIQDVFALVQELRRKTNIPIAFLLYYNPVLQYGVQRFLEHCQEYGVDGVIIPDLPIEERQQIQKLVDDTIVGVDLIPLVAPTSKTRIQSVLAHASGFIYCISSMGVTGMRQQFAENLGEFLTQVGQASPLPKAIGFGISNPEAVRQLAPWADGLIVGSAIVRHIETELEKGAAGDICNAVHSFVAAMRTSLDT